MKAHPANEATTVYPILREDGTVYFHRVGKPLSERLCDWTLAFLWFLVPAVPVAVLLWG